MGTKKSMISVTQVKDHKVRVFTIERPTIPCETCGDPTPMLGTKRCDGCWEVETRLLSYLKNENAIRFVSEALDKAKRYRENGN